MGLVNRALSTFGGACPRSTAGGGSCWSSSSSTSRSCSCWCRRRSAPWISPSRTRRLAWARRPVAPSPRRILPILAPSLTAGGAARLHGHHGRLRHAHDHRRRPADASHPDVRGVHERTGWQPGHGEHARKPPDPGEHRGPDGPALLRLPQGLQRGLHPTVTRKADEPRADCSPSRSSPTRWSRWRSSPPSRSSSPRSCRRGGQ